MNYKLYLFLKKYFNGIFTKNVKNITIPKNVLLAKAKEKYVFANASISYLKYSYEEKE